MNAHTPIKAENPVFQLRDDFYRLHMAVKIMHRLIADNFADMCAYRQLGCLTGCETVEEELSDQSERLQELVDAFITKMDAAI